VPIGKGNLMSTLGVLVLGSKRARMGRDGSRHLFMRIPFVIDLEQKPVMQYKFYALVFGMMPDD